MKFRQTTFDPIIIEINGEQRTVDFVAETITVDGQTRPWDEHDRRIWPTAAEIAAFQAEDAAANAAREAEDARRENLAVPLIPAPIEGDTVAEVKASAETVIADLATQMQAKIDAILGGV